MHKKMGAFLALIACCAALAGCSSKWTQEEAALRVVSFSGSDALISVENGIIVLNGRRDAFYGGALTVEADAFGPARGFEQTFYLETAEGRRVVSSNAAMDMTGEPIALSDELARASGDIFSAADEAALANGLRFELTVIGMDGEEWTHALDLELRQIV